jgi:hypothetical protein
LFFSFGEYADFAEQLGLSVEVEWQWEVGATVTALFAIKDHIGR